MQDIYRAIDKLVAYALEKLELDPRDAVYARNTVLHIAGAEAYPGDTGARYEGESVGALLSALTSACVAAGTLDESDVDSASDAIMGALSLPPSAVRDEFERLRRRSARRATDWLYAYSVANDYVKKEKLDANPRFDGANGLTITINTSKPEFRDPKKAASGNSTKGGYPKCTICRENEGFFGRAKRTLRTVDLRLDGEDWFWQYSPYGYFREHGIAVNCKHTPMHVDRSTFVKLMDFVDAFPHYFIGCNAPLPRIGGSVLAHDHFQGGGEVLPLHRARIGLRMRAPDFPEAEVGVLDWPGTAVRVVSRDRDVVAELCERIRAHWVSYRDEERGLIPEDADGVHNAVSPTVTKRNGKYSMNVILRSNITSERYPDGVFHAHPEFHVIKKESIGLIEAQGLFILPGRLVRQLAELEGLLARGEELTDALSDFSMIFSELKARLAGDGTPERIHEAVKAELADVCERILRNTAVFERAEDCAEFLKGAGFDLP